MGDSRKLKNHFSSVRRPYDVAMLEEERELKKKYGIRRKSELRRMEYIWKNIRQRARRLIAEKDKAKTELLFNKVDSLGLCPGEKSLENILGMKLVDVLDRRFQNVLCRLNLANTPMQARQFIVHKHVKINGTIIFSPNYIVKKEEENNIVVDEKLTRGDATIDSSAKPVEKKEVAVEEKKEEAKEKTGEKKEEVKEEQKIEKKDESAEKEGKTVKEESK
ncbi:MAG: 30S ribosomal protein S4 [Candidatus Aenigmarchaeota archaeon]|nr:30S ribosomal protein S4 [Candidatus Aenigmarchaeota archaeon]